MFSGLTTPSDGGWKYSGKAGKRDAKKVNYYLGRGALACEGGWRSRWEISISAFPANEDIPTLGDGRENKLSGEEEDRNYGTQKERSPVDWNALNNSRAGLIWFNHFESKIVKRKREEEMYPITSDGISVGTSHKKHTLGSLLSFVGSRSSPSVVTWWESSVRVA